MANPKKIVAVAVSFLPDIDDLKSLLEATSPQVTLVVVVDNTPNPNPDLLSCCPKLNNLKLISLGENFGIAYAQNRGIEWAQENGADYVLLLDQDSVPYPDMVSKLMRYYSSDDANSHIAAVGPVTVDARSGIKSYFLTSRFWLPVRYRPNKKKSNNLISVSFLIASGSLINMAVISRMGGKRSSYFIDHVDTEWCFRARQNGFKLLGVHDAFLKHSLGDTVKRVWFLYIRYVAYHSPLRDYYMFRNTIHILRDVKMPFPWQVFMLFRLIQFMVYFLIFAKERKVRLRSMFLGLFHGLKGIDGKLDQSTGLCTKIPITSLDPRQ